MYLGTEAVFPGSGTIPAKPGLLYSWDDAAKAWKAESLTGLSGNPKTIAFRGSEVYLGTDAADVQQTVADRRG